MEMNGQVQGNNKCQQRNDERKNANVAIAAGQQDQQQRTRQRREGHQGQNEGAEVVDVHRTPSQIM
jgi:hypothetical protein